MLLKFISRLWKRAESHDSDARVDDLAAVSGAQAQDGISETKAGEPLDQGDAASDSTAPVIIAPPSCKVGVSFLIQTRNIPGGTPILADKKYPLGKLGEDGTAMIAMGVPGQRNIDIRWDNTWVSAAVLIEPIQEQ